MSLRLSAASAAALPASVRRPGYDRRRLLPGVLHLGVGAFHRCHQEDYADDAIEAAGGDWGVVGVNLAEPDSAAALTAQDGLYCRELREGGAAERRLIGALLRVVPASDRAAALAAALDPAIRAVTLTVTEKGYCHVPATGALDDGHPAVLADLAAPERPGTAPGFITRLMELRWARGLPAPAFVSCDNVPGNGDTLRACVTGIARLRDAGLADRIAAEGVFLNTMVDRIVPATRPEDRDGFAAETGVADEGLVVGEPFRMWVIEDRGAVLPPWDRAGAILAPDVAPYETLKMRVVNGIQSNLCQLGALDGIAFMAEVMADPVFARFAETTIRREVLPYLPDAPGIDPEAYLAQTLRRLRNPDLRHGTAQISTDGSQKVRQRLVEPLRAARAAGGPFAGLALGLAGWMQHACGRDRAGRALVFEDPLADRTRAIGQATTGDPRGRVLALLGLGEVFAPELAADAELVDQLAEFVALLGRAPARDAAQALVAA